MANDILFNVFSTTQNTCIKTKHTVIREILHIDRYPAIDCAPNAYESRVVQTCKFCHVPMVGVDIANNLPNIVYDGRKSIDNLDEV